MTIRTFTLAALLATTIVGAATADERINLTPTLYREQARATASRIWHAFGQKDLPADADSEFADFSGELMF